MITRTHQMNSKQMTDLDVLMTNCKNIDGNNIPIYKHLIDKRHTLPCNMMHYDEGKLIGFLRTFFFYSSACEIALMVDPSYRRQGIAKALLTEILPLLQKEYLEYLIFSVPKGFHQEWFTQLGFTFRGSEIQMQYDPQKPATIPYKPASIRLATAKDIATLVALDQLCFPNKKNDPEDIFRNLLITNNCAIFVLIQDDKIVGKAHLFKEADRARITDIGVFSEYRGRGFASTLIKYCINHALINNKPKIVLDVEVHNETALKLYDGLGFKITNAHDYWNTPTNAPEFGLSAFLRDSDTRIPMNAESQKKDDS